jgi:hypothetical protein
LLHQSEVSVVVVVAVPVVVLEVVVVIVLVVVVAGMQQISGDPLLKRAGHLPVRSLSPTQNVVVEVVYLHGPEVSTPVRSTPQPSHSQATGGGGGGGHVFSL